MGKALYRKYRSRSLGEIFGQGHVTDVLEKSLAQGKIAHAYLLTGPRGVGKTSIARILAHEINQLPYSDTPHLDIIEIDAASNNSVEDVRDLREKVQIAPVSAQKKVYIIDEVHMLSKAAFNALLKTLEEPPKHAVFILATTDADKLPPTIISRTQRFSLRAISREDTVKHLAYIAKEEGIEIEDDALELIASRGDGSFRDSISLLDQLSSLAGKEKITRANVEQALGLAPKEEVLKLLEAYESKDLAVILKLLGECEAAGIQAHILASQLMSTIRERLFERPHLLSLLDMLLEVPRSSHPDLKLLTVLAQQGGRAKSAALSVHSASISASVDKLESPALPASAIAQKQSGRNQEKAKSKIQDVSRAGKAESSDLPDATEHSSEQERGEPKTTISEIDWPKLMEYTRKHYVAIYSVLSRCSHEIIDGELTIYTGNAFYKKKLDDTKYKVNLTKSLVEIGAGDIAIHTVPALPSPKDSLAASVAAIMGGGEEVAVGEIEASKA